MTEDVFQNALYFNCGFKLEKEQVKGFNASQYCVNDENVMFVASLEIGVY